MSTKTRIAFAAALTGLAALPQNGTRADAIMNYNRDYRLETLRKCARDSMNFAWEKHCHATYHADVARDAKEALVRCQGKDAAPSVQCLADYANNATVTEAPPVERPPLTRDPIIHDRFIFGPIVIFQ